MASFFTTSFFLTSSLLLLFAAASDAHSSFRPKALVLPVQKDASTLQYVTTIDQRTPLVPLTVVVHLGGQFLWVNCDDGSYASSSYRPAKCGSAQCRLARSTSCGHCTGGPKPGCNANTCGALQDNPFILTVSYGEQAQDAVSLPSTDGSNPGPPAADPRLVFSCGSAVLLRGLGRNATGILGLGRARVGVPEQLSAAFSFGRKFALCLSSSTSANGVLFFGDGPYNLVPDVDASSSLAYTPLYVNPVSTASAYNAGEKSTEYFVRVNSVRVGGNPVKVNGTLLTIDGEGYGGTKISTVDPYTLLETSIYRALTSAYVREAAKRSITRVSSVGQFEFCFSTKDVGTTRVGPAVPYVELVLQGEKATWTITGSNSMVFVGNGTMCLGFLDGGLRPRTSVVIGGRQLEDNLLQFDLAASRLGFSSTFLGRRTSCANFNFTSN